jgi:DNA mismatch repair protein MutS
MFVALAPLNTIGNTLAFRRELLVEGNYVSGVIMHEPSLSHKRSREAAKTDMQQHAAQDLGALEVPERGKSLLRSSESLVTEFGIETLLLASQDFFYESAFKRFHDTAMTQATPRFAELEKLHRVLDTTSTVFGKLALLRHLIRPSTGLAEIIHRQEAVKELTANDVLRDQVQRFVDSCVTGHAKGDLSRQDKILTLLGGPTPAREPYLPFLLKKLVKQLFNAGERCSDPLSQLGKICAESGSIENVESAHLQDTLAIFQEARQHSQFPVFRGEVCITPGKIGPRSAIRHVVPAWSFTAKPIDVEQMALGALYAASYGYLVVRGDMLDENVKGLLASGLGLGGMIIGVGRLGAAPRMVVKRASAMLLSAEPLLKVLDAVGELDALLAIVRFNERNKAFNSWPELFEADRYHLEAEGMRAPVVHEQAHCVANSAVLTGGRPLIITGPNSAGKSTFINAVSHNQILAQIGAKVLATRFRVSVCDHFSYQGPDSVALSSEGRFGMEMLETKRSFERASAKSLVVLDEVAGGTATDESREIAEWIIHDGLRELGCGAVMVTHDHELARKLDVRGGVDCAMLTLEDEQPTYRVQPGIATSSRPDRVLRSIGFTREDMERILREKRIGDS